MKKEIKINTQKDLERFYLLLPSYKSFVFKPFRFELKEDKYNVSDIIYCLNIKNRKKRILYIYDKSYQLVDEYYKGKNLCKFKNNKCMIQKEASKRENGCCGTCLYQSTSGCKTQNIACKLHYCLAVSKKCKIMKYEDIKLLRCLTLRQRMLLKHSYFLNKDDILANLYIGSVIIGITRILYKLIANVIRLRRQENRRFTE